jgi:mRNA-degrading endonuclease YafQ of YafQ-DinJ toxin-antitoxin module
MFPDAPVITEVDMQRCRENGDFSPVLFEWYKFIGGLCVTFANLLQDSPVVRKDIEARDYGILIGLINRCARLILANVALSHKGNFGESTSILDRCIFESCVILSWLCNSKVQDKFDRYIASGLKTELELKSEVQKSVEARDGVVLNIEKRMLLSIKECLFEAGFDDEKIKNTKGLPDLAAMLNSLGHQRLSYTTGQRIGSHHVHGTWVGLRNHYIELDESGIYRTKQMSETHINQYIYITYIVLEALSNFVNYVFNFHEDEKNVILQLFEDTAEEITNLNNEIRGTDFHESEHDF